MHVWTFDYRALTLMKVLQCYCTRQYFLIQFLVLQKEYYLYFTTTLIYNKCNLVCKNSLVKKSSAKETNNISQTFHVTFFKKECCKARIKTDTVWQKTLLKNDRIMLDEMTQKNTCKFVNNTCSFFDFLLLLSLKYGKFLDVTFHQA